MFRKACSCETNKVSHYDNEIYHQLITTQLIAAIMAYLLQFCVTKQRNVLYRLHESKENEVEEASSKGDIDLHEIFVS